MIKVKNIRGISRLLLLARVNFGISFHYIPYLLSGKVSWKQFVLFLKRMTIFSKVLEENKFVKVNGKTRMGLFIPGYKSKPYFTACNKFLEFEGIMPAVQVLFSITSACGYACEHCYQRKDRGKDANIDDIIKAAKEMQELGVAYFIIEGGEPFLVYDRLKKLVAAIDDRSEIWVNTNGDGLTRNRLRELKSLGLTVLQFSMHYSNPEEYNRFLKSDKAWDTLVNAVNICKEEGVPIAFNVCLKKEAFYDGRFEQIMERAREFNGFYVQIIHPKLSGAWLESDMEPFGKDDFKRVKELTLKYNVNKGYSSYPAISAQIMEEDPNMFGCTAGGIDRFYVNAKGDVQPCEFFHVTFGNIANENIDSIYRRMRGYFYPSGQNWLCDHCSKDIARLYKKHNLNTLPLNEELSREVYSNMDKGSLTGFYAQLYEGCDVKEIQRSGK